MSSSGAWLGSNRRIGGVVGVRFSGGGNMAIGIRAVPFGLQLRHVGVVKERLVSGFCMRRDR